MKVKPPKEHHSGVSGFKSRALADLSAFVIPENNGKRWQKTPKIMSGLYRMQIVEQSGPQNSLALHADIMIDFHC